MLLAQTDFSVIDQLKSSSSDVLPGAEWVLAKGGAENGFTQLFSLVLTAFLVIVGILVLIYLLWGALDWITSAGDSGKISSARNKIVKAIIGLIVLASTFAIFGAIQAAFGLDLLKLSFPKVTTKTTLENRTTPEKSSKPFPGDKTTIEKLRSI